MRWLQILKEIYDDNVELLVGNKTTSRRLNEDDLSIHDRRKASLKRRNAEIVKANARGQVVASHREGQQQFVNYQVHYDLLIKQKDHFYEEEQIESRQAVIENNEVIKDKLINAQGENENGHLLESMVFADEGDERARWEYDRRAAVRYAERWWNSYNPAYKKFDVDCTNFVSQCVHAGNAPMRGYPDRSKGWWYRDKQWSYSWAVAHSFRWYLSGSQSGLQAREASSAEELQPGDVICYDFEGDGKWNHNTIVVAKDGNNEPLVNAHTTNSRMRFWDYTDSTAWTPDISYKFFHIIDDE